MSIAPGIYQIPDAEYHADRTALSASGAKLLLPPSCPALFRYRMDNPPEPTAAFDIGHAAHRLVLGDGPEIVPVWFSDWRTKEAREQREKVHADGGVPLLGEDFKRVHGMAEVIEAHPVASALFNPDHGKPEQTLRWVDEQTGVPLKARLDWLPEARGGRIIVTDYKTTQSAEPEAFARSAATYGYELQAAWYIDGVRALGLDDDPGFLFVAQEKTAPYLVNVIELSAKDIELGRRRMRRAINLYKHCTDTDTWPGYGDDIALVSLPRWVEYRDEAEAEAFNDYQFGNAA